MRTRLALLAALSLSGCQTIHDLVGVDASPVASEIKKYDGSYQGTLTQVVARSVACPSEHGEHVFMVGDGTFWFADTPDVIFTAPVTQDGSITGTAGRVRMSGRISGNHLSADIQSPDCETRISADYLLNH